MPDNVCVGETKRYRVDQHTGSSYEWKIDGVVVQSGPSNELVHTWNVPNTYTVEVQESSSEGCIGLPSTGQVIVTAQITPTFAQIAPVCQNSTAPILPLASTNATPITGTWNPTAINTAVAGTVTYTFTPDAGQCAAQTTMDIVVTTQITPTFTQIAPVCQNATAPVLPLISTNGITGTWNPAVISTTTAGTVTYTFTPEPVAGQCFTSPTMDIVVTPEITPAFTQIAPVCQNTTAPVLPLTSTNGITGTWNPSVISTTTAGTVTYTFTPAPVAGQCFASPTMDIVVTPEITPAFTQIAPVCQNTTAPVLPLTSTNGITGTWNPAVISTTTAGTVTYTFTPEPVAGQCFTSPTMDIVVTPEITPAFTQIAPVCQNATAPVLPLTSTNGITGTWNPAVISTTTAGTVTYTFTPEPVAGQCFSSPTMDIVVTPAITPAFTQIAPVCQNTTAPVLPLTSTNGITGTWNPAVISTTTAGTVTYTFTPEPVAGQCLTSPTMDIVVTPAPSAPTASVSIQPSCTLSTGTITVTAPANGAGITYTVTGTTPIVAPITNATGLFAGLNPGTYNVTVTVNGCESTATTLIVDAVPAAPVAPTATVSTQPTCSISTGTITVTAPANGVGITYTITGTNPVVAPITNATGLFAGLNTGIYDVTVTDNGCESTATTLIVNAVPAAPTAPTATVTTQPTCSVSTGTITVTAPANGTGITYTVTGTNPVVAPITNATGLFAGLNPGTYNVTVTVNGCESTATTLIVDAIPAAPVAPTATVTTQPTCSITTGTITVTAPANGVGITYTVTGTNPVVAPVTNATGLFAGLNPGIYDVTVTDNGCESTAATLVVNAVPAAPTAPTATVTTQPTCSVSTGTITVTAPANGAGITYTITGTTPVVAPVTNATGLFAGLNPGTYNVTVTDNGCESTATTLIINAVPSAPVAPTASVTTQPSCTVSTGTITVTAPANGVGITYTVTGTNPVVAPVTNATGLFAGLNPGNYEVTVTDNGCESTATTLIINAVPSAPVAPTASVTTQPSCRVSTGTITVTAPANGTGITYTVTGTNPVVASITNATGLFGGLNPGLYEVTVTDNGCESPTTALTVNSNSTIVPTFTAVAPICSGATLTALPTTSNNGISGTWSPALNNISTTTYLFTPDVNQCATTTTMEIVVTTSILPTFNAIGPLCQGSISPVLPLASSNGINGTWSPAAISTATVGTSTYTFTPAAGQCASVATVDIEITNSITPQFNGVGPLCQGSPASSLPPASTNGISGTWAPAAIRTSTVGTSAYTFTPAAGQCAVPVTLEVVITNSITPLFAAIGPLPQNSIAPALPATSSNGISGTWTPATISTSTTGTSTYTFTPAAGQCASSETMDIEVIAVVPASFTVTKTQTAGPNPVTSAGQVITYTIVLTNTGSEDITGVVATETYPGAGAGTLNGPTESISNNNVLNAGENWRYTARYTVTQNDIDGGNNLVNTIRVVTTQIPGPTIATETTPLNSGTASLTISKSALETGFSRVGNVIHYTIIVTNRGNVTLTDIEVSDPLTDLDETIASLAPGASSTFNTTHTIVQNDLNTGHVDNTATASYNYRGTLYTQTARVRVPANQGPDLSITKRVAESGYTAVGNILHYRIVVTNTGNVTLSNILVTDPLTRLTQSILSLAPGDNLPINTTYTITQNDLNTGHVDNTATAAYNFGGRLYND